MKRFHLGLDYDGVVTRHPDHLRFLADRILMSGGEVHIITGRRQQDRQETLHRLREMRFRFTELHLYPGDYKYVVGSKLTPADLEAIGAWKQYTCEDLGIDLFMDDNLHNYEGEFPCPVAHV